MSDNQPMTDAEIDALSDDQLRRTQRRDTIGSIPGSSASEPGAKPLTWAASACSRSHQLKARYMR